MNTQTLKSNIKELYRSYADRYRAISSDSWMKKVNDLKAGEPMPQKGVLYYSDDVESFRTQADELRHKGLDEIEKALNRIAEVKAEAPSSEACNYINMLRDKKNITDHDIEIALTHYGNNYSAHNAIMDIAEDHKIYGYARTTPLDTTEHRILEVRDNLYRMDVYAAQRQTPGDGYTAMMELVIDEIPDQII